MKHALVTSALISTLLVSACGNIFGEKDDKPPLPGERISVLDFEKDLRPEEAAASKPTALPEMRQNAEWPQAGGYPDHAMHNVALTTKQPQKIWSASIGRGARKNLPLTTQPVLIGQSIFALDTEAKLSSFDTATGQRRWSVDVGDPIEDDAVISGGIAADKAVIYVTAGYDELVAVNAQDGKILWRSKLTAPSRAAPTVSQGRVFVTTLSNSLIALDAASGTVLWEFSGLGQSTGLVGAASPAASGDLVVPAFSSGELYALRAGNGSVTWSDNLAGTLRLGGLSALSDIRGLPAIVDGTVYAISFGGKMAAIDLATGSRLWQRDISGAKTPWVAGNRIFLISSDSQIMSLDRATGAVVWISQLARYKDSKDKSDPIIWTGPLMAGGRLIAFSSDGRIAEIDPAKGTLIREWHNGDKMAVSPIIAGGVLYILADDGTLTAYK